MPSTYFDCCEGAERALREVGASSAMTLGYALRPSTATASGRASGSASSAISCFSARSLSAAPPRPSSACVQSESRCQGLE